MIRLKKLTARNFRSFPKIDLDFPEKGLVLISGTNLMSGDASGAGKSSIMLAIAYALDVLPVGFPATELQSWGSKDTYVAIELDVDGLSVVICRGKKSFLKVGDREITGAKPVSEALTKLFRLSQEVLGAITYRPQNSPGLFLSKTPAEKVEFLVSVLGLDAIETASQAAAEKAKGLLAKLEVETRARDILHHNVISNEAILTSMKGFDISSYEKAVEEANREKILAHENERELFDIENKLKQDLASKLQDKKKEIMDRLAVAHIRVVDLKVARDAQVRQALEAKTALTKELDAVRKEYDECQQAKSKGRDLTIKLKSLMEGKCPTCSKPWEDHTAERASTERLLTELATKVRQEPEIKARLDLVKGKLDATGIVFFTELDAAVEAERAINAELLAASNIVRNPAEEAIHQQWASAHTHLHEVAGPKLVKAIATLDSAKETNRKTEETRKIIDAKVKAEAQEYQTRSDECIRLKDEWAKEQDFADATGKTGFLGLIFEEILEEIATEANKRLARLSNVQNVTVAFRTESTSQAGKTKRAITTVIYVGGREVSFNAGISGGQQTSVEQAIDLSVMAVIERRSGRAPGWLCLDEVFNGQGRASKESALEVLREFSQDKLILVIDHGSEFKEMFAQVIEVEKQANQSIIKGTK